MDKRFVAVLIFAFFMATLASTTLYRLTINRSPARAALPAEKLVFASHDLEAGTVLGEGDLVLTDSRLRRRRAAKPVVAEVTPPPAPQAPPPPDAKKEEPFTMEFLLGPNRIETKFQPK